MLTGNARKVGEVEMKEYIVQAIAQETIDSFDAHNAPELVRCKDCKKCDLPEEEPYEDGYCSRCGYVKMDWFCADGERK